MASYLNRGTWPRKSPPERPSIYRRRIQHRGVGYEALANGVARGKIVAEIG